MIKHIRYTEKNFCMVLEKEHSSTNNSFRNLMQLLATGFGLIFYNLGHRQQGELRYVILWKYEP